MIHRMIIFCVNCLFKPQGAAGIYCVFCYLLYGLSKTQHLRTCYKITKAKFQLKIFTVRQNKQCHLLGWPEGEQINRFSYFSQSAQPWPLQNNAQTPQAGSFEVQYPSLEHCCVSCRHQAWIINVLMFPYLKPHFSCIFYVSPDSEAQLICMEGTSWNVNMPTVPRARIL